MHIQSKCAENSVKMNRKRETTRNERTKNKNITNRNSTKRNSRCWAIMKHQNHMTDKNTKEKEEKLRSTEIVL